MSTASIDPTPAAPQLLTSTATTEQGVRLTLDGEIDLASAPSLEQELLQIEASGPSDITLDLHRLQFIDSTGLHVIIAAHMRAERNGHRLVLTNIPGHAQRLFRLTGLDSRFATA